MPTVLGQNAISYPSGTTAQRPTPSNGMVRYNTTTARLESYSNGDWVAANNTFDGFAAFEYHRTSGGFSGTYPAGVMSGTDRAIMPFNFLRDPNDIIATASSNTFTVQKTGVHLMQGQIGSHSQKHKWNPYVYNNTDGGWAAAPNSAYTGPSTVSYTPIGYDNVNDAHPPACPQYYWLETGHTYTFRYQTESTGGLGTGTSWLQPGFTAGIPMYLAMTRMTMFRVRGY